MVGKHAELALLREQFREEIDKRRALEHENEELRRRVTGPDAPNQDLFCQLVATSTAVIYAREPFGEHAVTFVSENVRPRLGFSPAECLRDPHFWLIRVHPEDADAVFEELHAVLEQGYGVLEYRFRVSNGSYRWLHDELNAIRNGDGTLQRIIGYWTDITERREAEETIRRSESRLSYLLTASPAVIYSRTPDCRHTMTFVSVNVEDHLGYAAAAFVANPEFWTVRVHAEDAARVVAALEDVLEQGHGVVEYRFRVCDGSYRWLRDEMNLVRDADRMPREIVGCWIDITNRRKAEEALRNSEASLANAQRIARLGNWDWNVVTNKLWWSDEIYRIFGLTPREFGATYDAFLATVHADDRRFVEEAVRRSLTGDPYSIDHRIVLPDGAVKIVHEEAEVTFDRKGKPLVMSGTVQDITEQRRTETALWQSREHLRLIMDNVPVAITYVDREQRYRFVNRCYGELLSLPADEITGKPVKEVLGPAYDAIEARITATLAGERQRFERTLAIPSGQRQLVATYVPDLGSNGDVQGMFTLIQDITDITRTRRKLTETETLFRNVFESSMAGIAIGRSDGTIEACNPAFEDFIGYSEEELKTLGWDGITHADDLEECRKLPFEISNGTRKSYRLEKRYVHKRGHTVWANLSVSHFESPDGEILFVGAVEDLTERVRMIEALTEREQSLALALEKAQSADLAKSQFLANMSHELRTPLNAILGFTEMMRSGIAGPAGSDKCQEYLGYILQSGNHLLDLVNDILDTSNLEYGHVELRDERVSLPQVIETCLGMIRGVAEAKGIALLVNADATLPLVRGDPQKLRQVLVNLLSNAVKFTETAGTVSVLARRGNPSGVEVVVRDTGIGIAPEDIPKALSLFGQVIGTSSRPHEGTGLGLPLAKRLVELHGGSLDIMSELGKGTEVTLTFPSEWVQG